MRFPAICRAGCFLGAAGGAMTETSEKRHLRVDAGRRRHKVRLTDRTANCRSIPPTALRPAVVDRPRPRAAARDDRANCLGLDQRMSRHYPDNRNILCRFVSIIRRKVHR
jgi:hypothetical protein